MEAETKSQSSPWLVFFYERQKGKHQTFFSLAEGRSLVKNIRQMQNDICWPTPQGWMLMIHPGGEYCYLLDPITMAKKNLPPFKQDFKDDLICSLSSSPTSLNCKILCANLEKGCLFFCQLGDRQWVQFKYDRGDDNLTNVATCKGKFYGITRQDNFAVIDGLPDHPRVDVLEPVNIHWLVGLASYNSYLVESCGEMFSVKRYYGGWHSDKTCYISIMKRNSLKQEWDTVDNISGMVMFIGIDNFSASCSANEVGVKGNCVYFVEKNDRRVYCFDLEEGCISVELLCHCEGSEGLTPIWIMPAI